MENCLKLWHDLPKMFRIMYNYTYFMYTCIMFTCITTKQFRGVYIYVHVHVVTRGSPLRSAEFRENFRKQKTFQCYVIINDMKQHAAYTHVYTHSHTSNVTKFFKVSFNKGNTSHTMSSQTTHVKHLSNEDTSLMRTNSKLMKTIICFLKRGHLSNKGISLFPVVSSPRLCLHSTL